MCRPDDKPVRYRRASTDDRAIINRLLADAHLPYDDVAPHLHNFIVAAQGDTVVGIIGLEIYGHIGLLRSLVVAPTMRRCGIGRRLCEGLIQHARAQDVHDLYLLTMDTEDYFSALGFKPIDRALAPAAIQSTQQFGGLCPTSAALMVRELRAQGGADA